MSARPATPFSRGCLAVACAAAVACQFPPESASAPGDARPRADGLAAPPGLPRLVGMWGGMGTAPGEFIEPSSIELDGEGFVYVAGHEDRVQKFTRDGELVLIWGNRGTGEGELNHPHGLAIDRARGDLVYVGDQENHRVQVFRPDGTFVRQWADPQFRHIHDVGIDPEAGNIYVGDYEADVVQMFSPDGTSLADLGGEGEGPGQFRGVWGISTDSHGDVYAADTFNRRVQRLPRGATTFEPWRDSGDGVDFQKPTGVFVDADDVIHVCDSVAETVYRFDRAGALIDRWSLPEILGTASEPEDIVIDATGSHLYIAEVRGHRVFHLTRDP